MENTLTSVLESPFRFFVRAIWEIQSYTLLAVRAIANVFTARFIGGDRSANGQDRGRIAHHHRIDRLFYRRGVGNSIEGALRRYGAVSMTGQLVSLTLIRELGRSLSADACRAHRFGIASELGSMVVSDQINAMRSLGTDPTRRLVTPG